MQTKVAPPMPDKQILTRVPSRYALPKDKKEYVLGEEVARGQLMMLLGYYDIDIERISADEGATKSLEKTFDGLVDYIRLGKLEVRRTPGKEQVEVEHTLESGSALVYKELGAPAKLAMDACPDQSHYARVYALMGSLSSVGTDGITKLCARDLAIVEVLAALFLAA